MLNNNEIEEDQMLFRQIASGDQHAFTTVFHKYSNRLYWNAYKLLQSEFWAEEVVQLVFSQLWTNRTNLEQIVSPPSYLCRMVINKARDRMRKHTLEIKMQYWLERQEEGSMQEQQVTTSSEEMYSLLEKAVESLPPKRKQVYILKYQDRLSYEEIAAQLKLSKFSVRNHMSMALEDIRVYLLKHGGILGLWACLYFF